MVNDMKHLDPRFLTDNHLLGSIGICTVLLNRQSAIPWLVIAPDIEETDFLRLPTQVQHEILDVCTQLDRFVRSYWKLDKTNFATMGNLVPQMHLHVVGRHKNDVCWPKPIWGFYEHPDTYSEEEIPRIIASLAASCPNFKAAG